MKKLLLFIVFAFIMLNVNAQVINVPADYDKIQDAIAAANDGDTVLVDEGTYYEHINFLGKKITVASNYLVNPQNPFAINNTIIDGTNPGRADSNSVVHFISGEDTTSILYGFTIQNGSGTAYKGGGILVHNSGAKIQHNRVRYNKVLPSGYGGGIYVGALGYQPQHYVIIENNTIEYDSLTGLQPSGGGIWIKLNGRIKDNLIQNNDLTSVPTAGHGAGEGAGIYCDLYDIDTEEHYSVEISGNTIKNNTTNAIYTRGGGIYAYGGHVEITNNTVSGNSIVSDGPDADNAAGAGMHLGWLSKGSFVSGNTIENNTAFCEWAFSRGGGINIYSWVDTVFSNDRMVIEKNIFKQNVADHGGGLRVFACNVDVTNNFFMENIGTTQGGAIRVSGTLEHPDSVITIVNNTLLNNESPFGIIYIYSNSKFLVMNNIFHDTAGYAPYETFSSGIDSMMQIHNCLIDPSKIGGSYQAFNNMTGDPELKEGSYELLSSSPCVGGGIEKLNVFGGIFECPVDDILGMPRPQSGTPEIGCQELMFVQLEDKLNTYTSVNIRPNPAKETATISFDENGTLFIYDLAGNLIHEETLYCPGNRTCESSVKTAQYSPGIYTIRVISGNDVVSGKLVIVR